VSYHDMPIAEVLSVEASEDGTTWVHVGRLAPDRRSLVLDAAFAARVQSVLPIRDDDNALRLLAKGRLGRTRACRVCRRCRRQSLDRRTPTP